MKKRYRVLILPVMALGFLGGCQKQKLAENAAEAALHVIEEGKQESDISLADVVIDDGVIKTESEQAEIVIEPETQTEAQSETLPEDITIMFAGDVLLSDYVLNAYENAGGIQGVLDEGYRQAIEEADFFFVNEEFPFSDRGTQAPDKQYTFRLAPEKVSLLQEMGIDGVSLANNHALDYGVDALLDTCDVLDQAGILRTGAGRNLEEAKRPVKMEIQGQKIAVIGATRVIPVAEWATHGEQAGMLAAYDPTILLEEIRRLSGEQDYVIVYVHWGIEREELPEDYQRAMGRQFIDAGADLVIGSHPHVLQGIEYYNGKPIVYSLGNYVFGSSIPRTMLLEVKLPGADTDSEENPEADSEGSLEEQKLQLRIIPGTSGGGYTQTLQDAGQLQEFYQYMQKISFGVSYGEDGNVIPQP